MTPGPVLAYLTELGAEWRGYGVAVECGSWLGATCAAMAAGLVMAGYHLPIHCFDRWWARPSEVRKAAAAGVRIETGQNIEPLFRANVTPIYPDVVTHRGGIQRADWPGEPIEVFILDAAKTEPAFSTVLQTFGPSWIPGVTVVGLMDFHYWRKKIGERLQARYRCQADFVEAHPSAFRLLREFTGSSAAFFRYTEPIEWDGR